MDERAFVEQKQESWKRLSSILDLIRKHGAKSLTNEQLTALGAEYRAVVSDLSFAQSQSASDGLVIYLNELAGRAHGAIYAAQPARMRGMVSFVSRDFPALFRASFVYVAVAALLFFIGWGIAASSPDITNALIPQEIKKPESGESPLTGVNPAFLSSFIMTNNINVGIRAFVGGITAGVYTVFELLQNGLVIGAVCTKAAPVMGQLKFWALILPHGVIELMAIFICGGAGLVIASGIIAPGNLRRADSIRIASGKALRLLAGAILMFVIAGTIEGFITPSMLPAAFKLTFAAATAVALALYLGFCGRGTAMKNAE